MRSLFSFSKSSHHVLTLPIAVISQNLSSASPSTKLVTPGFYPTFPAVPLDRRFRTWDADGLHSVAKT